MAFQSQIPVYQPRGETIAQLLMRQGDIAARGAERSGEIWGRVAENLGNIGAQAYTAHREQKDQQQRSQLMDQAISSWDGNDPRQLYRGFMVAGMSAPEAIRMTQGITSMRDVGRGKEPDENDLKAVVGTISAARKSFGDEKLAGMWQQQLPVLERFRSKFLPDVALSAEYTPEVGDFFDNLDAKFNGAKAPGLERVVTKDATGAETMQWVEPKVGQTFTSAAPVKEEKPDTRSLDARYAEAVASGDTATAQTLLAAKAKFEAAGGAPTGAGSKIWVVRNGQTVRIGENEYQPGDQPTGMRERPVTGAERTALSFYMRAQEASDNVSALEDKVRASGGLEQARRQWAPNILQSTDDQLYRQAQRAFTEARLRKDSGATIKKDEYESDAKTYFAQPGDSDEVLEQKRRGRAKVLESLKVTAGRAYGEHFGEDPGQTQQKSDPLGIR